MDIARIRNHIAASAHQIFLVDPHYCSFAGISLGQAFVGLHFHNSAGGDAAGIGHHPGVVEGYRRDSLIPDGVVYPQPLLLLGNGCAAFCTFAQNQLAGGHFHIIRNRCEYIQGRLLSGIDVCGGLYIFHSGVHCVLAVIIAAVKCRELDGFGLRVLHLDFTHQDVIPAAALQTVGRVQRNFQLADGGGIYRVAGFHRGTGISGIGRQIGHKHRNADGSGFGFHYNQLHSRAVNAGWQHTAVIIGRAFSRSQVVRMGGGILSGNGQGASACLVESGQSRYTDGLAAVILKGIYAFCVESVGSGSHTHRLDSSSQPGAVGGVGLQLPLVIGGDESADGHGLQYGGAGC
ncbi:hypothetical protein D3C75_640550 [compost metagenome]